MSYFALRRFWEVFWFYFIFMKIRNSNRRMWPKLGFLSNVWSGYPKSVFVGIHFIVSQAKHVDVKREIHIMS